MMCILVFAYGRLRGGVEIICLVTSLPRCEPDTAMSSPIHLDFSRRRGRQNITFSLLDTVILFSFSNLKKEVLYADLRKVLGHRVLLKHQQGSFFIQRRECLPTSPVMCYG